MKTQIKTRIVCLLVFLCSSGMGNAYGSTVSLSVSPSSPICSGANINFTATPSPAGSYTYRWYIWNGSAWVALSGSPWTNSTPSYAPNSSYDFKVELWDAGNTTLLATSNTVTSPAVNANPAVAITSDYGTTFCSSNPPNGGILDFTASGACGSCTFQWYKNGSPAGTGTSYSTLAYSFVATDNYSVVNTDGSTGCSATAYITVVSQNCTSHCDPIGFFGSGNNYIVLGNGNLPVNNTLSGQNIFVSDASGTGNVTIAGTYSYCTFLVDENTQISIDNTIGADIENCTFTTCASQTWTGIVYDGANAPGFVFNNNPQVENATTAVEIDNNDAGNVQIMGNDFNSGNTTCLYIHNCPNAAAGFAPITGNTFENSGTGISLNNSGSTGSGPTYNEIQIGDATNSPQSNIFRYLNNGIYALNSNFSSYANLFSHIIYTSGTTGDAVYASSSAGNQARIWNNTCGGCTTSNQFDNIDQNGVEISNYYQVLCSDNIMLGNRSYSAPAPACNNYAFHISSWYYNWIDVNNNTLTAMLNGINIISDVNAGHQAAGSINVDNNIIRSVPYGNTYDPGGLYSTYTINDITLTNNLSTMPTSVSGIISIEGNSLYDVYEGIHVNDYNYQQVITKNNTISVSDEDPFAYFGGPWYGIKHEYSSSDLIENNSITPSDAAIQANVSNAYGINVSNENGATIACNTTESIGRHIEFDNCNNAMAWQWNSMYNAAGDAEYGFVLNNSAVGTQYGAGYCMDSWDGNWSNASSYTLYVAGNTLTTTPSYTTLNVLYGSLPYDPNASTGGGIAGACGGCTAYAVGAGLNDPHTSVPSSPCPLPKHSPSNVGYAGKAVRQAYALSPNPGNGNITLSQAVADNEPVLLEVWDGTGKLQYKGHLQFTNARAMLKLGEALAPGLYMLRLTDGKGISYALRYVKE